MIFKVRPNVSLEHRMGVWARSGEYVEIPDGDDAVKGWIMGQEHKLRPATDDELRGGVRLVGPDPALVAQHARVPGFRAPRDCMIRLDERSRGDGKGTRRVLRPIVTKGG